MPTHNRFSPTHLRSLLLGLLALAGLLLALGLAPVTAQDATPTPTQPAPPDSGVWVTTQDRSSLRAGPGVAFARLAVVPPATTLPAIGRSADGRWVQVYYEGQTGWIVYWLLVWSGDLAQLPIDGVNPLPFVRRTGVVARTTRETPIYVREVTPGDQVGTIPGGTEVEVTARLGFVQYQVLYQGQVYWVSGVYLTFLSGDPSRLLDTRYLYAYGRLVSGLASDINSGQRSLSRIEDIWIRLSGGSAVSCASIPAQVARRTSQVDVNQEPVFTPVVQALDTAIGHTNTAISLFQDACARPDGFITERDIATALDEISSARRNYNLAASLLQSLSVRDPLINPPTTR